MLTEKRKYYEEEDLDDEVADIIEEIRELIDRVDEVNSIRAERGGTSELNKAVGRLYDAMEQLEDFS